MDDHGNPTTPRRARRGPARLAAALVVGLGIIVPGTALASHAFTDVPTTSTFHTVVAALAEAGITTGCAVGKYCPAEPVRRDQMAAFLTRGAGRMAATTVELQTIDPLAVNETISQLNIKTEGTANIHAMATFTVRMINGAFPCLARFFISVDGQLIGDAPYTLVNAYVGAAPAAGSAVVQMTAQSIQVVDGGWHSVRLVNNSRQMGTCTVSAGDGLLSATVVPFGPDGLTP
jgi:hypothetical protein